MWIVCEADDPENSPINLDLCRSVRKMYSDRLPAISFGSAGKWMFRTRRARDMEYDRIVKLLNVPSTESPYTWRIPANMLGD